jgi:hypothetical protein
MLANYLIRSLKHEHLYYTDSIDLIINWLAAKHIIDYKDRVQVIPLDKALRYQIIQFIFRSKRLTSEEKHRQLKLEME